jgi:hypothetical protein
MCCSSISPAAVSAGEVPVEMRPRRAGESFYTLGKSLYYPYKNMLASLMVLLRRRERP